MAPDGRTLIEGSVLYGLGQTLWRWIAHSRTAALLGDTRVLFAGAVVVVAFSILQILFSDLDVTIKFASFLVFAVVLVVLVWPYTKPLTKP